MLAKINRESQIAGLIIESELKFNIDIPEGIKEINQAFKKHAQKIFLVGGCVRDSLLGIKPKDFDITTNVHPKEVQKILNDEGIKNFPKGEQFGVISAVINNEEFEIATFRTESYEDGNGRRPTSIKYSDMIGDSKRRDAKINALYYDIDKGSIIDVVGGLEDIKNKKVTPVGNPFDRIEEDKLRSLRFIRFSNRFGSKLDENTIKAILKYKDLPGVSNERIRDEFLKGLVSAISTEKFLKDYEQLDLFKRMFGSSTIINKNYINDLKDPILTLANLLYLNNIDSVVNVLNNFKSSNEERNAVKFLLNFYSKFKDFDKLVFIPETDGKWFMNLKNEFNKSGLTSEQLLKWAKIRNIDNSLVQKFISFTPTITAKDFPNIPPGPELGNAIIIANSEAFLKLL